MTVATKKLALEIHTHTANRQVSCCKEQREVMATCIPAGMPTIAVHSSTKFYSWGLFSWWLAKARAMDAAENVHPAAVSAATTTACGIGPDACTCTTSVAGPFCLISSTGFFSGAVTATVVSIVTPTFVCGTVPAGAIGYATAADTY